MGRERNVEIPGESEQPEDEEVRQESEEDAVDYIVMLIMQLTGDEKRQLFNKLEINTERKAVANSNSEEPRPIGGNTKTLTDKGWLIE